MKFFDLTAQYKSIKKEVDSAVKKVLGRGEFIGGKEVEEFEKEFARFCGVKYAASLNSGTDALTLSLKSMGIGRGDEVITTPFTFIATAGAIVNAGAKPVFADIDPNTYNINPVKIEEYLIKKLKTKNYNLKTIIPVHLFGQMANMEAIMEIARKHKLFVVEDAAQAIGALKTMKAGSVGDIGCFSFFPAKNLGAYGNGGMAVTNNKKLAEKVRLLRNHGSSPKNKYLNLIVGTNSRLDAIQAAVLRVKLKHLKEWNRRRQEIAQYYDKSLEGVRDIKIPEIMPGNTHIFHQYTIRTKWRDKLQKYLARRGIPTMVYYSLPLHLQPALKYLGYKKGDFPEAEKAAREALSLPVYPELSQKQRNYIVRKITHFFARQGKISGVFN